MPRDSDDSDVDSDFSDIDYTLHEVPEVITSYISETKANELWNKQSGCCWVTNIPMATNTNTLYSIDVAPRRVTEPISDENCILVLNAIKNMQESTSLTWSQFKSFITVLANGIQ